MKQELSIKKDVGGWIAALIIAVFVVLLSMGFFDEAFSGDVLEFQGVWLPDYNYNTQDVVYYDGDGSAYVALGPSLGVIPGVDPNTWSLMAYSQPGPQGPVGPQGPPGSGGGSSWGFVDNPPCPNMSVGDMCYIGSTGVLMQFVDNGGVLFWESVGSLQGPAGPAGPVGPAGEVGPAGPAGPAGSVGQWDVIENLADTSKYTEVDSAGRVSLNYWLATIYNMPKTETVYLVRDHGAGALNAFVLKFSGSIKSTGTPLGQVVVSFSNVLGEYSESLPGDFHVSLYNNGVGVYTVFVIRGNNLASVGQAISPNVTYYFLLTHVAGADDVSLGIYLDSGCSNRVGNVLTLSGLGAGSSWRYFYPVRSRNTGVSNQSFTGDLGLFRWEFLQP